MRIEITKNFKRKIETFQKKINDSLPNLRKIETKFLILEELPEALQWVSNERKK